MKFKRYTDVHEFYNDTYDVLMLSESQNMIILGNVIIGHEGKDKTSRCDPAYWLMATVSDAKGIRLTALMTPPHNIPLYATDNTMNPEAIRCLIDGLKDCEIPGVITEKSLAEYFAKEYTARKGQTYKTVMNQRIYELTTVSPEVKQFGTVRLLNEKDLYFFPYRLEAFNASTESGGTAMREPRDIDMYRYRISSKKIYILEVDGIPVSMAGYTRELQTAIGIAFVYTPPCYRGKGYATSCVAQISQLALDNGYTKCVLYTDLANPTSNSIYQKIGYRPVCDSHMLKFE
jgi:predicted GNAT family acetyltransferase